MSFEPNIEFTCEIHGTCIARLGKTSMKKIKQNGYNCSSCKHHLGKTKPMKLKYL